MENSFEIYAGPMFCGKSAEVIRRLKKERDFAKKSIILFKPKKDDRYALNEVITHDKESKMEAVNVEITDMHKIYELGKDKDVIGIDELQFFQDPLDILGSSTKMMAYLQKLFDMGKTIVCSGLDLNYLAEPFAIMGMAMCAATYIEKMTFVCKKCLCLDATRSWLIGLESPSGYKDTTGGSDKYEPLCHKCFNENMEAL